MKKIDLYVWYSAGDGDSNGYESTMEVSDEQYEIFKELQLSDEELDEIDDERIMDVCQKAYQKEIDDLKENSDCEDMMDEECYVDADDPDFWDYENRDTDQQMYYTFIISADEKEYKFSYKLTPSEKEMIYHSVDEDIEFVDNEDLSDLYSKITAAVEEKIDEEYEILFNGYPEYQPRCCYSSDEYFDEVYTYGVRLNHEF